MLNQKQCLIGAWLQETEIEQNCFYWNAQIVPIKFQKNIIGLNYSVLENDYGYVLTVLFIISVSRICGVILCLYVNVIYVNQI